MVEAPQAGARVGGKYVLVSHIADGGMGSVWTAQNAATSSDVAVKLWRRRSGDESTVERLRQEARLGSRLSHRNIVRIFDLVEEAEGPLVLVMELLRGCSLERYLQQRGALEPKTAVGIVVAMLSALSEAHAKGIIHRDIKPANVFLAADHDGRVIPKLLDFGIAKMPVENKNLTEDGRSLGTPRYMSPEQIRGTELDGKSDVFSAAVVLYEALTNVSPFDSGSSGAMLAAVLEREVDPHPLIPPRVWVELSRALSKRAYERHASARELKDALVAAMETTESDLEDALKHLDPMAIAPLPPRPPQSSVQEIIVPLPTGSRPEPRFSLAAKAVAGFGAAALFSAGIFVAFAPGRSKPTGEAPPVVSTLAATSSATTARATSIPPPDPTPTTSASAATAPSDTATGSAPPGTGTPGTAATGTGTIKKPVGTGTTKPTASAKPIATKPGF